MAFQGQLDYLSTLTPSKVSNGVKLLSSYFYSKWRRKPFHSGWPTSISIEPTTACNLGCPECPSGLKQFSRPTGNLKTEMLDKILNELTGDLSSITFYFQGEPYINPNFLDYVKKASDRNVYTVTSTNAHFLDDENARRTVESGLNKMIISIDGVTQEVYEQYRVHGKLSKVIEGTKNIVKWKRKLKSKTPHVVFQFLVVRPNEHQVEQVKQLAGELGVDDVAYKTAQIYNYKNGNPLIPENEKFSRYKKLTNGTYGIKNKLLNQCWKMWHSCVITWDGKVVPCCFDKDATHQLGDLTKQSFKEIWRGDAYNNFRASLLKSRKEIDICKNCTEGTKVWT